MLETGKLSGRTDQTCLDSACIISEISIGLVLFWSKYLRTEIGGRDDKEPMEMAVPSVFIQAASPLGVGTARGLFSFPSFFLSSVCFPHLDLVSLASVHEATL